LEPRRLLATYTVDTLVDENDGNQGTGDFSLREAIAAAHANAGADTINFHSSLANGTLHLSQTLVIQSSLTLNGGANDITIDADGNSGVFFVYGGVVVSISNLGITGGQASLGGGLHINNNASGAPQVTLTRVNIGGNHADIDGGGIYSDEAKLTIIECNINNNNADDNGGGLFAIRGELEVRNSTFARNGALGPGGGILISGPVGSNDPSDPAMFFSNSTIALNTTADHSGGVGVIGNAARFVNCTIVLNHADTSGESLHDGGGIRTETDASTTLFNTIVAGNRRGTGAGVLNDLYGAVQANSGYNLIGSPGSAGGLTNGVNGNQVGKNGGTRPLNEVLTSVGSPLPHGGPTTTYTLVNNSPALDAGRNPLAVNSAGAALTTDQRGTKFPRVKDGPDSNSTATVDIGALEMALPEFSMGAGASYTENAAPVLIAPGANMFGDFFLFPSATLTVSLSANGKVGDRITILHQGNGQGQVGVQGTEIRYSNVVIGTFSPSTNVPPLQIDFADVTVDAVEAVLRRLAFSTSGNNPSSDTRTVFVEFNPFLGQEITSDLVPVTVVPQNDAPTLDNAPSPTLFPIPEDTTNPANTLVSALLGDAVTDPDGGAQEGMAVTTASNFNGTWQFTLDAGMTWQAMGAPTSSAARLLPSNASTRIRFLPNADFNGTVQLFYRAWDRTQGTSGGTLDTAGNTGGTGSLSTASESAAQTVNPVNDAPQVALSGTINYTADAGPITLAPNAGVSDVDSTDFDGGGLLVQITDGANASNRLTIGVGFTIDANNNVLQGSTIIGTRTANGFGTNDLIVTFNTAATPAVVQQLVRAITFKTVGGSAGIRKVVFTVSDGDGGLSDEATKFVNVT
jgi:CSLREA domain-containing protein